LITRDARAPRQPGAQHHGVQQITFAAEVVGNGAVIERAGQRRNEVDALRPAAFDEAPARHLDGHFELQVVVEVIEPRRRHVGDYARLDGRIFTVSVGRFEPARRGNAAIPY
jgi:hypothetical protein